MFTSEQVWGMAMAAHRINGGYVKETEWDYDVQPAAVKREANKLVIKRWVKATDLNAVEPLDLERGQEVRAHFRSYMFLAIAGKLNDFQKQAYKIAERESFTDRDWFELAIVSCLPMIYERDRQRKEFMDSLRDSTQLTGNVGDRVEGEIIVLDSRYNINFNKWRISAKMVDSYIDFWYNKTIAKGTVLRIKGKIKAMRADNTTQLNYVKETLDK
jgi:hypothetical protein